MEVGGASPENQWSGGFKVITTVGSAKRGLGANYFAYLSDVARDELGISGQAVVVRTFDNGLVPQGPETRPPQMRARCQIAKSNREPADEEVRLDQTLRNALGIGVVPADGDEVDIYDLKRSRFRTFGERFCDWLLRRRYLFMRVRKADPADMEKRMVRIPPDSFRLLGISSGEKLRISHPTPEEGQTDGPFIEQRCTLQAYPVTPGIEERQKSSAGGLYDRYPDPGELLGVKPDLGAIYLDQSAREALGVRTLEVVRVRRADPDAFMQQIRSFGLATAAGAIAISGVFGIGKSFATGLLVLAAAILVAAAFSIFNLRASSYGTP
jgi:hypothetical protein